MTRRFFPATLAVLLAIAAPLGAATLDGMKIHSTASGKGGKTLVLVHGWTCDDTSWAANVPELSKHYRVVTLDLPGHGQSGSPKDGKLTMDLFARAVEAVRAEQRADKIVLVGHSMGTPVIRQYARLYPQHVAALVIVDGVVMAPPQGGRGIAPPVNPAQFEGPDGLQARERFIKGMFTPKTPQDVQQRVLKMMLAPPATTATGAMVATFDPATFPDEVMTMPVYGIYAEKSVLLGNPETVKKVFPKMAVVEMPGTGHFVMMEQPAEFNQLVEKFVDSIR
jgi:pimeloyl-ACP methyl ester carboxylesterase